MMQDAYVNSKVLPLNKNKVVFDEEAGVLSVTCASGTETVKLLSDDEFTTVDKNCDASVRSLYKYMDAIGRSKFVMFGQENNLQCKAGDRDASHSDTFDLTGDYPALQAFDVLSFTGVEFSAERLNRQYTSDIPGWKALEKIDTATLDKTEADIYAAAALARRAIDLGGVFSLSAHMPNFLFSKIREGYVEGVSPAIAKYNYKEYTPNRCEGKVVLEVMPGGKANDAFTRYLDIVAMFAKAVEKPFFFRPLHENTGSWFWWGADHCTPDAISSSISGIQREFIISSTPTAREARIRTPKSMGSGFPAMTLSTSWALICTTLKRRTAKAMSSLKDLKISWLYWMNSPLPIKNLWLLRRPVLQASVLTKIATQHPSTLQVTLICIGTATFSTVRQSPTLPTSCFGQTSQSTALTTRLM